MVLRPIIFYFKLSNLNTVATIPRDSGGYMLSKKEKWSGDVEWRGGAERRGETGIRFRERRVSWLGLKWILRYNM